MEPAKNPKCSHTEWCWPCTHSSYFHRRLEKPPTDIDKPHSFGRPVENLTLHSLTLVPPARLCTARSRSQQHLHMGPNDPSAALLRKRLCMCCHKLGGTLSCGLSCISLPGVTAKLACKPCDNKGVLPRQRLSCSLINCVAWCRGSCAGYNVKRYTRNTYQCQKPSATTVGGSPAC